jgi:hypothetical protein
MAEQECLKTTFSAKRPPQTRDLGGGAGAGQLFLICGYRKKKKYHSAFGL